MGKATRNFQGIHDRVEKKKKMRRERDSNSMKGHRAFLVRRTRRRSELGRQTEGRVAGLLAKKLGAGELISYEYFSPNGPEDHEGKDFQVTKEIDGQQITTYFGITTSLRSHQDHRWKHPGVPSILIPPEMGDEKIWQKICQIIKEARNARA